MRVIKPQQLGFLNRPFEYRGGCYLGVSVIAALRLNDTGHLVSEVEMWQEAMPALGDQGVLDVGMPKRRGEFLAAGQAFAPNGEPTQSLRAGIQVGGLAKELWVFGDRFMQDGRISEPEPFVTMPMVWENAFGGEGFKPNPLGKGYRATANSRGDTRHWLPNIEHPDRLYRLKGQKPEPAGFGALDITWPQRQDLAGTYDDHWLKTAFPGFAKDIQWEYFNMASRDQWSEQAFSGDETFRIYGMHPELSVIDGKLPGLRARCFFLREGMEQIVECACELTTLWFLPEADLLILIHHGSIKVEEDDARDIKSVTVAAEHADRPRERAHYQQVHDERADPEGDPMKLIKDAPLLPEGMERSIVQSILDQISESGKSPLTRNIESAMAEKEQALRKEAEESGHTIPEDYWPKMADEPLPPIEELDSYMEEKFEFLEEKRREIESEREKVFARAREAFDEVDEKPEGLPDLDQLIDQKEGEGPGPPKFSARQQREQLREQIAEARSIGFDPSDIESQFDTDEQFEVWQEQETQLNDLYRMGAHFQEPAPRAEDSEALTERLFRMLDAGEDLWSQDFTGIDLSGADLSRRNLRGVFMENAILDGANLSGATLDHAVLAHASLDGTILDGASLVEANLGKSRMLGVSAKGGVFEEAVLFGAVVDQSDFTDVRMSGQMLFMEASVIGCRFANARVEDMFVNERAMTETDFSGATLINPVFIKADLAGADFSNAVMEEAVFVGCSAAGAGFAGARMAGSIFAQDCLLADCNFAGADLSRANLRGAVLHRCNFAGAVLREADLSETEASGAVFRQVSADQSRWIRSDLREADFAGARLIGSMLQKADIRGTDLRANLYQADLGRVHVERSTNFKNAMTAKMNTYPRKFPRDSETDG